MIDYTTMSHEELAKAARPLHQRRQNVNATQAERDEAQDEYDRLDAAARALNSNPETKLHVTGKIGMRLEDILEDALKQLQGRRKMTDVERRQPR